MTRKQAPSPVGIALDVEPRKPRLARIGMEARRDIAPVQTQVVEYVDPSHMTVYEGTRLLYSHPPDLGEPAARRKRRRR